MDQPHLTAALSAGLEQLPQQLQAAARWVLDHPADVALLTTREQAKRASLSPATLTRLAQRFGLSGYDELRAIHAAALRQRPEGFAGRAGELMQRHGDEGAGAIAQDMFAALTDHLRALREPDTQAQLERAAILLAEAQTVFCFGLRSAFPAAYMLDYIRDLIGAGSVLADGAGGRGIDALRRIGPSDAFFAVSVSPYTRLTLQAAELAKAKGARLIALTDSPLSPLATRASVTLIAQDSATFGFRSLTGTLCLAQSLFIALAYRMELVS